MKKLMTMLLILIMTFSFSSVAFGSELGELDSIKDVVLPDKEKGSITTTITGTTDEKGILVLPSYKDTEITKVNVKTGKLIENLKKQKNGSLEYYVAKFEEKESKVELILTQTQDKTFTISASKQKETFPGNVKVVNYKMRNNTPIEVKKYELEMGIPEGYELYNIAGYDPELSYKIFAKDGTKYGSFDFGRLSAGKDIKFSINIYKKGANFNFILWGAVILISAYFMYKNKGVLKEAKELKEKEKLSASK
ncbi:hypothetical protein [Clostridium hydrogeniformans]|uniref:hypothetical protein n=1 Tax=Clostridium hydrogeniformans TaxID=349933 RepID=UPI0006921456|nr:hypothetical protein [Clostridium hydrogeniformans]